MKKAKRQVKHLDQDLIEEDSGREKVKSFADDFAKDTIHGLWDQLVGTGDYRTDENQSGDLSEGQEISLKKVKKEVHIEAGIDYSREIVHTGQKDRSTENHELKIRIQEIVVELKNLVKSSKELEIQFKDVATIERVPKNAGVYHANFFEWILSSIKAARIKVENASSWMSHIKGKKNKRDYWSSFKKHGTSFGLSSERVVATQVG